MTKENKDGWIRHRGGKCPVEAGVLVEVRYRAELDDSQPVEGIQMRWDHIKTGGDIMSYRIHKPAEQPVIDPVIAENVKAFNDQAELRYDPCAQGPLQWRDRMHEIDRTIEALKEERASLIQRLESEGLQLLPAKACCPVPVEDWKVSAVTDGKYIQAIKEHRNLYGSGLKEAKLAVDAFRAAHHPQS